MTVSRNWPGQVPRDRVLANFKPDRFANRVGRQTWATRREKREGNSGAHLALVRQLWCTLGPERIVECHHLQGAVCRRERGLGMKSPDRWVLPLTHQRHMELHALGSRHEQAYFEEYGINPYALATALWENTGDLPRMARVLTAHQLAATKTRLSR